MRRVSRAPEQRRAASFARSQSLRGVSLAAVLHAQSSDVFALSHGSGGKQSAGEGFPALEELQRQIRSRSALERSCSSECWLRLLSHTHTSFVCAVNSRGHSRTHELLFVSHAGSHFGWTKHLFLRCMSQPWRLFSHSDHHSGLSRRIQPCRPRFATRTAL
jgi:hypothetical protein